jgi:hypothetical protein
MKMGAELFHADGETLKRTERQADMTKEKSPFTIFHTPLRLTVYSRRDVSRTFCVRKRMIQNITVGIGC